MILVIMGCLALDLGDIQAEIGMYRVYVGKYRHLGIYRDIKNRVQGLGAWCSRLRVKGIRVCCIVFWGDEFRV